MTTKEDARILLQNSTLSILKEVLHTNHIKTAEHASKDDCIMALVDGIWSQSHTPIGGLVAPMSLEEIIQVYAQKLDTPIDRATDIQSQL